MEFTINQSHMTHHRYCYCCWNRHRHSLYLLKLYRLHFYLSYWKFIILKYRMVIFTQACSTRVHLRAEFIFKQTMSSTLRVPMFWLSLFLKFLDFIQIWLNLYVAHNTRNIHFRILFFRSKIGCALYTTMHYTQVNTV